MTRKFRDNTLLIATHNAGKLKEMREIFGKIGVSVVGAADRNLPEPAETEVTFVGNARIKAHAAAKATGLPSLADDSGIEVEALDGAPGVHTADWAETGNGRDFMMAMQKTHDLLMQSGSPQPWRARFCATLVLAWPDGHDEVFQGAVTGELVWPPRGREGHGYDPIFKPDGHEMTFAEMDWSQKNNISHRARAIEQMVGQLVD